MNKRLILMILSILLVNGFGFAQDNISKIQVVGKSSFKAVPENFVIGIPINVSDSSYDPCFNKLISKLNRLQDELKEIGVNEELIKTLDFSISDDFIYDQGNKTNKGYKGFMLLQIIDKYSSKKLGEIISVLTNNKSTYSLGFKLSNSQIERLNEEAINSAIEDGNKKAKLIVNASGLALGKVLKISYNYSNYGNDLLIFEEEEDAAPVFSIVSNLNLSPKEISIDKKIFIEWEIKQ